jgi:spore germination protein KB
MTKPDQYGHSRLRSLCSVALLAPALRLIPAQTARLAGDACWLSILAAVPVILLDIWFLSAFMKCRAPGEGMSELLARALGPAAGGAAAGAFSLWLLFYCGFILRSGADRFISTVYPSSRPWVFSAVMLFLGLLAALGPEKTVSGTATVFRPLLFWVLGLVLVLAFTTASTKNLTPVTVSDALPVLKGAVPVLDVTGSVLTNVCFLEGGTEKEPRRFSAWAQWLILPAAFMLALCAATVGNFGGGLTATMNYPFFAMIRNVRIFRSVERIEALVVALWVAPDYILVSMLLIIASRTLMKLAGYVPREGMKLTSMANGRYIIWLCVLAAGAVSLFLAPDAFTLKFLSEKVIPGLNMALIFVLLPLCFAAGKLRKTI